MKVTVIIPTCNRYELLKRAIHSLLNQTHSVDEIIIIDDGSNDKTSQITQDFPSIKYFYQENRGVSSARNFGIREASNEWIAFLDSDDEWHKDKLREQMQFHKQNPTALISYTAEKWIRDGVEVKIPKKFRKIGKDAFRENLSYCNIAPSSVVMHKDLFLHVGVFDESLEVCEDYDLWLRILHVSDIFLIDKVLINKYAGHDEQLGFRKDMDKIRILILENLLVHSTCKEKKLLIAEELKAKKARQK